MILFDVFNRFDWNQVCFALFSTTLNTQIQHSHTKYQKHKATVTRCWQWLEHNCRNTYNDRNRHQTDSARVVIYSTEFELRFRFKVNLHLILLCKCVCVCSRNTFCSTLETSHADVQCARTCGPHAQFRLHFVHVIIVRIHVVCSMPSKLSWVSTF